MMVLSYPLSVWCTPHGELWCLTVWLPISSSRAEVTRGCNTKAAQNLPNLPGGGKKISIPGFSNRQPPATSLDPAYMVQPITDLRRGIINLRGQMPPTNQEQP